MPTLQQVLDMILRDNPWAARWFSDAAVVCHTAKGTFQAKHLNRPAPPQLEAVGCGGWTRNGDVRWVGLDLDVGHGAASYACLADALNDARRVHRHVCGAAEVRRSKSGKGLHVRIALAGVNGGRETAARIAKWLAYTLGLRADPSPLGRQNFWFWTRSPGPEAFALIVPATTVWTPPLTAQSSPLITHESAPIALSPCLQPHPRLSRRTREFLEHGAPEGQRNYRLFIAACDFAGAGIPEDQAASELTSVAASIGLSKAEAHATIDSAYSKPRTPASPSIITSRRCVPLRQGYQPSGNSTCQGGEHGVPA